MTGPRVHEVFAEALDHHPDTVDAFLERACAGEPDVRAEVASLLRARQAAEGFLEKAAPERPEILALVEPPRLVAGDLLDGYEILGVLGVGGSGVVYEARCKEPDRLVAVKVLRLGRRDGASRERVHAEAAALARLQHPAIAHVYAMGDFRGHPYLVIEHLAGARPVTEHARAAGLSVRQRLELLAAVCDGVHHGHQRRILHNDLKPANVLVGADGLPKIIDFGIAQVLEREGRRGAPGPLAGTLPYMSPEALASGPHDVDVRSDVYSLGVLGYELLVGAVPLDPGARPTEEAARWLREQIATPLHRRGSPLRGDLAAIAQKSMAFAPDARYASASALSADVRRLLDRRPVEARNGGALYHLGCVARRHRAAFAATLLLVLVSVTAALVAGSLALEKDREGRVARAERARAEFQSYVANVAAAASALSVHDVAEARTRLEQAPEPLRGWEWRHLASRLDTSERTLATDSSLEVGALSPDGELLLAGSGVWRAKTQQIRYRIELPILVVSAAFSPRRGPLILGGSHGELLILEAESGRLLAERRAHDGKVWAIACAPGGDRFATAGYDGTLALWSADGSLERTFARSAGRVFALAFDPSGSVLWSGGLDGVIRAWDVATGAESASLRAHEMSVEGVAVRPDGQAIASVSMDGRVALWDLATRRAVWAQDAHTSGVKAVAFSPDGSTLATVSVDRTARLWKAADGRELACFVGHTNMVRSVAFTPDGARLLTFSRDGSVKTWAVAAFEGVPALRGHRDLVSALRFSADGRTLASASADGEVRLWDTRGLAPAKILSERQPNPTHQTVTDLDVAAPWLCVLAEDVVRVWSLETGDLRRSLPVHATSLVAAPDAAGARVYVGENRRIEAFRADDATGLASWAAHDGPVKRLAISPSGEELASTDGTTLCVWAARSGALVASLPVEHGPVTALTFDPSGRRVAAAVGKGIVVFDVGTRSPVGLLDSAGVRVFSIAYSPDGRRIATASEDGAVRIWDAATGMPMLVLRGHRVYATSVAWSPDGTTLASGGGNAGEENCLVRVWRAAR